MAGINDNVVPQEEMNLLAEDEIKLEDVEIKVEVDWPWVDDLQLIPQQMPLPRVPQACPAQMSPPPMNEVEDIPRQMNLPPVQVELPQLQEVPEVPEQELNPDLMYQPHVDLLEPSVDLSLDHIVCRCLVKKSIFTRSMDRKHKEMCYEIYN